jgi:hypothetical protein
MTWHGKRRVEPEDIEALRQLERYEKAAELIRPQVEKLWEEVQKWMRKRGT